MVKAVDISYSYDDGTKALNHVNLEVKKGEIVSLLGKNGAGKSTLFLHFNGIYQADEGKIIIDGEELKHDKKSLIKFRQKIGIVFQNPDDQLFAPTVEEDVAFGPLNLGLSQAETQQRVTDALKKVGMEGFERKAPHHLSGGQKKRVAIAGILAMQPEIMVLDEPTSGLDPKGASDILKLLYELNEDGMTIISSGEIIKSGTPQEVFGDIELIRKANLRLPRVAHLFEILDKRDGFELNGEYPLTISEARKLANKLHDEK